MSEARLPRMGLDGHCWAFAAQITSEAGPLWSVCALYEHTGKVCVYVGACVCARKSRAYAPFVLLTGKDCRRPGPHNGNWHHSGGHGRLCRTTRIPPMRAHKTPSCLLSRYRASCCTSQAGAVWRKPPSGQRNLVVALTRISGGANPGRQLAGFTNAQLGHAHGRLLLLLDQFSSSLSGRMAQKDRPRRTAQARLCPQSTLLSPDPALDIAVCWHVVQLGRRKGY
jgi:hypothetical protein